MNDRQTPVSERDLSHYERLGVSTQASQASLRQAFRRRSKSLHPDTTTLPVAEAAKKNYYALYIPRHGFGIFTSWDLCAENGEAPSDKIIAVAHTTPWHPSRRSPTQNPAPLASARPPSAATLASPHYLKVHPSQP